VRSLERFRLHHTGFVFQGFNLFPALSALEQVERRHPRSVGPRGARARDADARGSGIAAAHAPAAGRDVRRREAAVAVARALAKQPKLLFADEPTSALDAGNGQVMIDLLHRIAREYGTTVLCVSHDPRLVGHADRVLSMEDGRIFDDRRQHVPARMKSGNP
jgi:putative ABC transport system ATP-binding protein